MEWRLGKRVSRGSLCLTVAGAAAVWSPFWEAGTVTPSSRESWDLCVEAALESGHPACSGSILGRRMMVVRGIL